MTVHGIAQFALASSPCAPACRRHDMTAVTPVRNFRTWPVRTSIGPEFLRAPLEVILQARHSNLATWADRPL
jgi:hypothetical protein